MPLKLSLPKPMLLLILLVCGLSACQSSQFSQQDLKGYAQAHEVYPLRDLQPWCEKAMKLQPESWWIPAMVYLEGGGGEVRVVYFGEGRENDQGVLPIIWREKYLANGLLAEVKALGKGEGPFPVWLNGSWDFDTQGYSDQMKFFVRKVKGRASPENETLVIWWKEK